MPIHVLSFRCVKYKCNRNHFFLDSNFIGDTMEESHSHLQLAQYLSGKNRFVSYEKFALHEKWDEKKNGAAAYSHRECIFCTPNSIEKQTQSDGEKINQKCDYNKFKIITLVDMSSNSWNTEIFRTPICGPCLNVDCVVRSMVVIARNFLYYLFLSLLTLTFST